MSAKIKLISFSHFTLICNYLRSATIPVIGLKHGKISH